MHPGMHTHLGRVYGFNKGLLASSGKGLVVLCDDTGVTRDSERRALYTRAGGARQRAALRSTQSEILYDTIVWHLFRV